MTFRPAVVAHISSARPLIPLLPAAVGLLHRDLVVADVLPVHAVDRPAHIAWVRVLHESEVAFHLDVGDLAETLEFVPNIRLLDVAGDASDEDRLFFVFSCHLNK